MNPEIKQRLDDIRNGIVPQGYKKTKIGIVPVEWEYVKFGDNASIKVAKDLNESIYSNKYDSMHKYPVFSNTVANEGLYGFYAEAQYKGDCVTVVGRGIGLGTPFYRNTSFGAVGRLLIIYPDNNNDAQFICIYIEHKIKVFFESGGIPQLTGQSFKGYKYLKPSLPEQKKIAEILTTWDKAIELKKELIKQKKLQKKGLMQLLLTGEKRVVNPDTGLEFDDEWKEVRLGEVASFFSGGTPLRSNSNYYIGDIPFIGSGNITDASVNTYINKTALSSSSAKLVNQGDILYALYGATSGEVAISKIDGAINQAVLCIRSSENDYYLYTLLKFNKERIVATYLQGGQGNLSAQIIKKLWVKLPSIPEQIAIARILSKADKEIELLEQQLELLQEQKRGMMQLLLTGIVRVEN